ncbi:MAG: 3-hydroxyacyl-ACP dehydratase FabZ, partial [Pseudomonadota bacterium]
MSDQDTTELRTIDLAGILEKIPHRYPMLLIDRVEEIERGESACGIKNVTINEPFFAGHFPQQPIMPGVLIIEAMAQTAAVVSMDALGSDANGKVVYFMSIDGVRFRKPVVPGDQLKLRVQKQRNRGAVWRFEGKAYVNEALVTEATFA